MGDHGARDSAAAEPSVHQLRLFLVLSEELHFGRAAGRLFISQSALSQQLKDMEKRLRVRLFERTSRTVELTTAGRALQAEARTVVEGIDQLRRTADAQLRQLTGRLTVGTVGAEAAMPYTRAVLQELNHQHPHITVQVLSLNLVDHFADLMQQKVDVVFLRPPVPDGIELHQLAIEPRVACLPADDPLANEPQIMLEQLADRPVVDVPPQVPRTWWDFWAVDPRPDGSRVRYGPVVTDLEALLHIVAQGKAMSFLPAAARDFFPRPGIRYVDVVDLSPSTCSLAWLSKRRNEPTITAIRQAARTHTRRPGP
ncbi:LysR family transcriptional regulator [Actinomadura rudentiformis]|uniref:LysR family transcriptional regulator n=1 Tax=Actinomadura rudentiformis TaxID=359158 RepID=A0A6H9YG15_9ACTN|nr:LysR family transcriptional regulator [Actinomadura rudentiformis]KAB2339288.1 LysR family transcriptional regulator [Actinomadura rudentiformis]